MAKTRGTGLLMAWMDVDPPHEDAFNRWYNEEHIGRLLAIPGSSPRPLCRLARRPKIPRDVRTRGPQRAAQRGIPRCGALPAIAGTHPLLRRLCRRKYLLNGYRQIFPARTDPIDNTMGPSPFLQMGRIDIAASMEEEFNDWYNTAYIPGYLTVPGCIRARRYLAVEGQPQYLTVYQFENAGVPDTPEWARARTGNPWNARMRPHVRLDEGSPAVFRRIFPA